MLCFADEYPMKNWSKTSDDLNKETIPGIPDTGWPKSVSRTRSEEKYSGELPGPTTSKAIYK